MTGIKKLGFALCALSLLYPFQLPAQQPQVDNIRMKGDRKALKKKLKGAEDLPKRKPKGKTETRCRFDIKLTEPAAPDARKSLRDSVGRREDAFLKALLAAGGVAALRREVARAAA